MNVPQEKEISRKFVTIKIFYNPSANKWFIRRYYEVITEQEEKQ